MSRRKSSGELMSLFPFMSILVCLIGSLTLMITLLMATQANSDQSQETLSRYQKFTELEADIQFTQNELDAIEELMKDARRLQEEAQKALEEVAALEKEQGDLAQRMNVNSEYARMLAEANDLRKRLPNLEKLPEELQKEIDKLEAEVKRLDAGPEEAVVQIRPGGSGVDIDPTFVECTATGLIVHGDGEPQRILTADIAKEGGEFYKLLEQVAGKPNGEIILLVRPDAVGVYNAARNAARSMYTNNGYAKVGKLPVPSQGHIDLDIFRRN